MNLKCLTSMNFTCLKKVKYPLRYLAVKNHNWQRQLDDNEKKRKTIPTIVYLHNPWKFLITKMNIFKLRWLWDREFREADFVRGSQQAAVLMTDIIRTQNAAKISKFTTPIGYQQITRDMLMSRNDLRLKLVKFDIEHLRRSILMKVVTHNHYGRKFCFIDMLFVGMRNTKDFSTSEEAVEINNALRQLDAEAKTPFEYRSVPHRIVFAEIFMRFRRDYSEKNIKGDKNAQSSQWIISFYKILTFDVLNYDPQK